MLIIDSSNDPASLQSLLLANLIVQNHTCCWSLIICSTSTGLLTTDILKRTLFGTTCFTSLSSNSLDLFLYIIFKNIYIIIRQLFVSLYFESNSSSIPSSWLNSPPNQEKGNFASKQRNHKSCTYENNVLLL